MLPVRQLKQQIRKEIAAVILPPNEIQHESDVVADKVKVRDVDEYMDLPIYKWGIRQPSLDAQCEDALTNGPLDLVLVPGVAFTADGLRLGHGKGYYDSFLHDHHSKYGCYPYTIALALQHQIRSSIPVTDFDVKIDEVIFQ